MADGATTIEVPKEIQREFKTRKQLLSGWENELNDLVRPISWLVGKWRALNGTGIMPGNQEFTYNERLEFLISGKQPILKYTAESSHPVKHNPMHLESGFIRGIGGGRFAFMVSHNFGVVSLEEGTFSEEAMELVLESVHINRMSNAKEPAVLKTLRKFRLASTGALTQELWMATTTSPELTKHLEAVYAKE